MATQSDPKNHGQEPDDITQMMVIIGGLLLASMVIGYFVAL